MISKCLVGSVDLLFDIPVSTPYLPHPAPHSSFNNQDQPRFSKIPFASFAFIPLTPKART